MKARDLRYAGAVLAIACAALCAVAAIFTPTCSRSDRWVSWARSWPSMRIWPLSMS